MVPFSKDAYHVWTDRRIAFPRLVQRGAAMPRLLGSSKNQRTVEHVLFFSPLGSWRQPQPASLCPAPAKHPGQGGRWSTIRGPELLGFRTLLFQ